MTGILDPYSEFLDEKSLGYLIEDTQGEFEGLGIEIDVRKDYIVIVSPLEGTPAFRMGLQAGDKIIEIEGQSTKGISPEKALSKLRGKKGTTVNITVLRDGLDKPMKYSLIRDVIEIKSVPYYGTTQDGIGYIRLNRFAETSPNEVKQALEQLKKNNPKGIILDLRSNPGGLLSSAVEIAGFFLGKEKLIVETKGRDITQNRKFQYSQEALCPDLPLAVLVDRGSASASEIVAGAIQDWDRGIIVGDTTFGKGLVQTLINLNDGSALKLTTAKYYIPSGRLIQRPIEKEADSANTSNINTLPDTSKKQSEKEIFFTKKGRKVYGGGGIVPDVEVEWEKSNSLEFGLLSQQMFFEFALYYTAQNKDIPKDFTVDDKMIEQFREFLKRKDFKFSTPYQMELDKLKQSLKGDLGSTAELDNSLNGLSLLLDKEKEREYDQSREYIKWKIKEEILSKVYGREAMYRYVWIKWHPEILKAIELLGQQDKYRTLLSTGKGEKP
jgi:carboxyl-terminal processing protease